MTQKISKPKQADEDEAYVPQNVQYQKPKAQTFSMFEKAKSDWQSNWRPWHRTRGCQRVQNHGRFHYRKSDRALPPPPQPRDQEENYFN